METINAKNGKTSSLHIDGTFVYLGVVLVVNIKLLTSTNNYTFFAFFFSLGSIAIFVVTFYVMNLLYFFPDI